MTTEGMSLQEQDDETVGETIRLRKSTGEAAILLLLGALGVFTVVYSQMELPLQNPFGAGVGPRLFPQLAGAVMVLMSAYLLALRFWRRRRGTIDDEIIEIGVRDELRVLTFIALCVGYMLAFEEIGFFVTTSVALFLMFITNGFRRYAVAIVTAVGVTIGIYLMFTVALGLPLPAPVLDEFIGGYL